MITTALSVVVSTDFVGLEAAISQVYLAPLYPSEIVNKNKRLCTKHRDVLQTQTEFFTAQVRVHQRSVRRLSE